jgi:hypothetical protein
MLEIVRRGDDAPPFCSELVEQGVEELFAGAVDSRVRLVEE